MPIWLVGINDLLESGLETGLGYLTVLVEVEGLVERIVDAASYIVLGVEISPVRLGHHGEGQVEGVAADRELLVDVDCLLRETSAVRLDLVEPCANLRAGQRPIGEEVEQSSFLGIKPRQPFVDRLLEVLNVPLSVAECLGEHVLDGVDKPCWWLGGFVVVDDLVLDLPSGQGWHVAAEVRTTGTGEVLVGAASAGGFGVDQAGLVSSLMAPLTEQQPT